MLTKQNRTILRRRGLALLLVLVICLSLFPATALADENEEVVTTEEIVETEEFIAEEAEAIITEEAELEEELVVEEDTEVIIETSEAYYDNETPDEIENIEDEEEVTEENVKTETVVICDPDAENDNDELFQAYFENLLMPHPRLRRPVGASNLSGVDLTIYGLLGERVNTVSEQGGSTVFEISILDIGTQLSWTKEELGGITIKDKDGRTTDEAMAAVSDRLNTGNSDLIISALLQDYPYGMYWYDKTVGVKVDIHYWLAPTSKKITISRGTITYTFEVSCNYGSNYVVDSEEVLRAQTAAENARAIVST